jgi:hypothetical protein
MGPRELWILAEATQILIREDGLPRYVVDAPDEAFEVVSRPVYEDGVMRRYPGEIVG